MFSTLSGTQIVIWSTFEMSFANAYKLNWSKILSFGKELNIEKSQENQTSKNILKKGC